MAEGPTRAELLERCQALGLKATGWKKEKMAAELAKLRPPVAPQPEQATSEQEPDEKPERASSGTCGWCQPAPRWARSHLQCRESDRPCGCECNEPGWTRPEIPEGAQLSRFNREDREPRGLPWDPRPGSQLADKAKLAEGLKEVNDSDSTGSAGPAPGERADGLAGLVPAAAGEAG